MKDQGTSQFDYSLAVNIASESVSAHKNQSTEKLGLKTDVKNLEGITFFR